MRALIILLLLLIPTSSYAAKDECTVLRIVDGDTIEVPLSCLPKNMKLFVRVHGIDTPEKGGRAECKEEAELADKASRLTQTLVSGAGYKAVLTNHKWDKFGGRMLADVNLAGVDLRDALLEKKYARSYHGEKKTSWCEEK
jgi:micrococcal nuclease